MKKNILFILVNLLVLIGFSQNSRPFIYNYSPKEYNAYIQNWNAVQDNKGVMYFANNYGVLIYNGNSWGLVATTNQSIVRTLSIDDKGTIWVGGVNQFGYLKTSSTGELSFISLTDSILNKIGDFGNVWDIIFYQKKILFSTDHGVLEYKNGVVQKTNIKTEKFLFKINNTIYTATKDTGIQVFKDNKYLKIDSNSFFKNKAVFGIIPLKNDALMILTRYNGLYYFKNGVVTALGNNKEQQIFKSSQLYCGIKLKDGNICLGTTKNGAIIINEKGQIKDIYNNTIGVQDNTCWGAYQDIQGNLWLMLDKGITKIEYNCPFSLYNQNVGIEGTIMSITRFNNQLYLATSLGIYYSVLDKNSEGSNLKFKLLTAIAGQCWDLAVMNGNLLVASSLGLFSINKNNTISTLDNDVVYTIEPSKNYANLVFIGKANQFSIGIFNHNWKEYPIDSTNYQVRSIYEESEKNVWLGTYIDGAVNVKYKLSSSFKPIHSTVKKYSIAEGLIGYEVDVFSYNNEIVFSTDVGLMKKKIKNNKIIFYNDTTFGTQFCDSTRLIYRLHQDNSRNVWMYAPYASGNIEGGLGFVKIGRNHTQWNYKLFNRLPKGLIFSIYPETNNNIWIGGVEGLIKFNVLKNNKSYNSIFYTIINQIKIGSDSILFNGNYELKPNTTPSKTQLNFTDNNIQFKYSCTNYFDEKRNQYRYQLIGFDKKWSLWSKDIKKQYTNLPEGDYTFIIKSKNIYGDVGIITKYKFQILPPWYRTWYAYLIYTIFLILLIYAIVRVSIYRLKLANIRLEGIIKKRTIEIREKNQRLAEALTDIKDSILYAKRLQDAILPKQAEINAIFKRNFIFYQPRDIVSGDFYWVTEKENKKIFIVADCTGHGVPGAFVSMLGNNLLNQIVNEKNITSPNLILNNLNTAVSKSFKSSDENFNANDGMDIAVCTITDNKTLAYAGAQRPLIMVNHKTLTEIKADKTPIGGRTPSSFKFKNNIFNISKGDSIYMFSDGYADQFGGPKGKKFLKKRLKELLQHNDNVSLNKQKRIIKDTFFNWKGNTEQLDDVLLVGIEF